MKTKAIRLPEQLLQGVDWIRRREGSEISHALRRLVRLGLERDLAERYRRGEVSLREVAEVLGCPPREVLDLLWNLGVQGNVTAAQTLTTLMTAKTIDRQGKWDKNKG